MTSAAKLPAIDSHHHFRDHNRGDYPWMAGSVLPIRRVFTPDDMRPLLAPAGVQKTILVQTWSSHAESRAFLALAQATDFIAGLVTWVDLEAPDVAEKPDDFCAGPQGMWLVGIRHQVQHQADPRWLCRSEVRRGLRAVPAHELVYDRLIVPRELIAALETVRVMPGLPYVIDHIAKPEIAKDGFVRWTKLMRPFDAERQVWCQLPGMVTEADWATWTTEQFTPYIADVLRIFGSKRCLMGSDWPVSLLASDYNRTVDLVRDAIAGLDEEDQRAVLWTSATEACQLHEGQL